MKGTWIAPSVEALDFYETANMWVWGAAPDGERIVGETVDGKPFDLDGIGERGVDCGEVKFPPTLS